MLQCKRANIHVRRRAGGRELLPTWTARRTVQGRVVVTRQQGDEGRRGGKVWTVTHLDCSENCTRPRGWSLGSRVTRAGGAGGWESVDCHPPGLLRELYEASGVVTGEQGDQGRRGGRVGERGLSPTRTGQRTVQGLRGGHWAAG